MVPSASDALADKLNVAGAFMLELFEGDVRLTVGATLGFVTAFTCIDTEDDVVTAPALSYAFAVNV